MPPESGRGSDQGVNRVDLSGRIIELGALRRTPAGIPVVEFRLGHASGQVEAEVPRQVECELPCVAVGQPALVLKGTPPGTGLRVAGFLAARSVKSRTPVLHVTNIEFVEGNENGIQTEE